MYYSQAVRLLAVVENMYVRYVRYVLLLTE